MFSLLWPILLLAFAGTLYNISARCVPSDCGVFPTLVVTYVVSTLLCLACLLGFGRFAGWSMDFAKVNWTAIAMGVAMVGLEVGAIFMYRAGWKVSTGSLVSHSTLAAMLLVVGVLFFKEHISFKQIVGLALCVSGLVLLLGDN